MSEERRPSREPAPAAEETPTESKARSEGATPPSPEPESLPEGAPLGNGSQQGNGSLPPPPAPGAAGRFFKSTGFRLLLVGILILLMLIPLAMVSSVVEERHLSYNSVLAEMSDHWGGEQTVTGPILTIPYTETYTVTEKTQDQEGRTYNTERQESVERLAVLLPKAIHLEGALSPEYRSRGIYHSLVYSETITVTGRFENIEAVVRSLVTEGRAYRINWEKAYLAVGLSDTTGIAKISPLEWGKSKLDFAPGTRLTEVVSSGFHARLTGPPASQARVDFRLKMHIKGSNGFRMAPVGELSEMHLTSDWAHPSFYGNLLPSKRTVTDEGFEATWSIPHLVRTYPQNWVVGNDNSPGIESFSVGVRLFEPVTIYTEATRAVKYGILFIALTFLTLILLEIITKSRPSMVQYVLIGAAMTVFYLLLIALAEHIGFGAAYAVAALTVVVMNTVYCRFVLSKKALAIIVTAVLSSLYGVLYMALRAEDYALLTGSVLLVIAVAVTMFFTRNIHKQNTP